MSRRLSEQRTELYTRSSAYGGEDRGRRGRLQRTPACRTSVGGREINPETRQGRWDCGAKPGKGEVRAARLGGEPARMATAVKEGRVVGGCGPRGRAIDERESFMREVNCRF